MNQVTLSIVAQIDKDGSDFQINYDAHPGILFTGGSYVKYQPGMESKEKEKIINRFKNVEGKNCIVKVKFKLIDNRPKQKTLEQFS